MYGSIYRAYKSNKIDLHIYKSNQVCWTFIQTPEPITCIWTNEHNVLVVSYI
jgi:hypothetical protein